jgi:hypothetical protein
MKQGLFIPIIIDHRKGSYNVAEHAIRPVARGAPGVLLGARKPRFELNGTQ